MAGCKLREELFTLVIIPPMPSQLLTRIIVTAGFVAMACILTPAVGIAQAGRVSPDALWSISVAQFGYELPAETESPFFRWGYVAQVIVTDDHVIAAFRIARQLEPQKPRYGSGSMAVRLVALNRATGAYQWRRDLHVLYPHNGAWIWRVEGIGFAIRAPDSLDLYSENGDLLRTMTVADSDTIPSPSGRTVAVAIPGHRERGDTQAIRTLVASDITGSGRRLSTIRAAFEQFAAGDHAVLFLAAPGQASRADPHPEWTLFLASEDQQPRALVRSRGEIFFSLVSDSLAWIGERASDWSATTVRLVDMRGHVLAQREFPAMIGGGSGARDRLAFALIHTENGRRPTKQEIGVYESSTFKELFSLALPKLPTVEARTALSPDGTVLVIFSDDLIALYPLPAPRKDP